LVLIILTTCVSRGEASPKGETRKGREKDEREMGQLCAHGKVRLELAVRRRKERKKEEK